MLFFSFAAVNSSNQSNLRERITLAHSSKLLSTTTGEVTVATTLGNLSHCCVCMHNQCLHSIFFFFLKSSSGSQTMDQCLPTLSLSSTHFNLINIISHTHTPISPDEPIGIWQGDVGFSVCPAGFWSLVQFFLSMLHSSHYNGTLQSVP